MTSNATPATASPAYQAALNDVVSYDASGHGRLRLTQRDRADLLHRLSTNDITALKAGSGARTALINHNARIIDLLTVFALPEHLLVTTSPAQAEPVLHLLHKNIFFKDQVSVEDITSGTVQYHLYGPRATELVQSATSVDPGDWPLYHIQAVSIGATSAGVQGWLARVAPISGDGYALFVRAEDEEHVRAAIKPATPLSDADWDLLRVEHGYPAFGRELSLDYIPLETRLVDAVSFTKGCYVGQEIIARMDSRGRLAKQLMGLRLTQRVEAGGKLQRDGKEMGDLTSVADSPRFGPIGLAYLRTAAATPGTELEVGDGVRAEVIELPFTEVERKG